MSRQEVCRDRKYVVTNVATKQAVATSVATSSMSRPSKLLRPVSRQAVCRDQCRNKQYVTTSVVTRRLCRDQIALSRPETLRNPKKSQNLIF